MSKYTTQVRYICETYAGLTSSVGYNSVTDVIQKAIPRIFDFDFPVYDPIYKNVLCTKILKHFYTREIGAETVGLWKLWLDTKLNEIMPYYNQLYKSALIEFNPMYDVDITTKHERNADDVTNATNNGSGSETTTRNNTQKEAYSDTPQGALDNVDNNTYLTYARNVKDNDTNVREYTSADTGKTTISSFEEYTETVSGKNGGPSYSQRLTEFRETFLNIDMMIIGELVPLFINLW